MNHQQTRAKNKKEPINGEYPSIEISGVDPERIFFHNLKSGFKITTLGHNNKVISRETYNIIKDGSLTIKSIIIYDKKNKKHELTLTLKEEKKKSNLFNGFSKNILITRKDLKYTSAYYLLSNMTPSEEFNLNKHDDITGNKYIKNNVIGGIGNNIIFGGDKNDNLAGGAGDDIIIGNKSFDSLFGQEGDDILLGGEGDDGLWGGLGNDILVGGDGIDDLYGDDEHSYSRIISPDDGSQRGNDIIFGGKGNDRIEGQKNNDYLAGGIGNDFYVFSVYDGINMIVEYSDEENTISIDDYFFHQLKFERYGNHLMISSTQSHANNLTIVIYNQYSADGYKVKNLQTRSYLRHGSENDKKCHAMVINNIVSRNTQNSEKTLMKLNHITDFGDHYYTDLSEVFCDEMPDTEKTSERKLSDILIEKNNALCEMYLENTLYFGDNSPDISYITHALSSFAPKEAAQFNINYLNRQMSLNNYVNSVITAKNQ
ncbi:TPA: calcium-binding protein [Yersinia enterocolitica]